MTHFVKRGDTPTLEWRCEADGEPVDLTGWTCLLMARRSGSTTLAINAAATVDDDPTTGVVSYTLAADELAVGRYYVEIQATSGSSVQSYPQSSYGIIEVSADLGPPEA